MKKGLFIFSGILLLTFIAIQVLSIWIERNLSHIINDQPNKSYRIDYTEFDLSIIRGSIDFKNVSIQPVKKEGTLINGSINEMQINGFRWMKLLTTKKLKVAEIIFDQPSFQVLLAEHDSSHVHHTKKVQHLFGDLLSRGTVKKFQINQGSVSIANQSNPEIEMARIASFSMEADGIETDSIVWNYPIPFQMQQFTTQIQGLSVKLDEFSAIRCDSITFRPHADELSLKNFSLQYDQDWIQVSNKLDHQLDLFEVALRELSIRGISKKSTFLGEIDISASSLVVDSLVFSDRRNKNKPLPPERVKPMFGEMIQSIPIGITIDTIQIKRATITYEELPNGKLLPGALYFNDFYGSIFHFSSVPSVQMEHKKIEADFIMKLNDAGDISVQLSIPYEEEGFHLKANIRSFDVAALNYTLLPMVEIETKSGIINELQLDMKANSLQAKNTMHLAYEDLSLSIMKEVDHHEKRRKLISGLANLAVRHNNIPGTADYVMADFISDRNQNKGPFNFMWKSIKEGIMKILPTHLALLLLGEHAS